MKRLLAPLVLVVLAVPLAPAGAVERGRPGLRLVYSAPSTSTGCRDVVEATGDGADPTVVRSCVEDAESPSPDGERLATRWHTSDAGGVVHGPYTGTDFQSEATGCAANGVPGEGIAWSPEGARVATVTNDVVTYGDGLYVIDLRVSQFGQRTPIVAGAFGSASWSPDGARIAFDAGGDIEVVRPDGSARRVLVGGPARDAAPAWSPDGRTVAFVREGRPFVAGADGSSPRAAADVAVRGRLSWSPDGDLLVVALTDGVATIDVARGTVTRLTTGDHLNPTLFRRTAVAGADGYGLAQSRGGYVRFGAACRSYERDRASDQPYVAVALAGAQAWWVTAAGRVDPTGSQRPLGNAPVKPGAPVVGIAATTSGKGYWVVRRDGAVFSFGDARYLGGMGGKRLNRPIVGITRTASGQGYWLVASDGGIFSFGDARFLGSTGAIRLNQPIVGMASTASGNGYWLYAGDGGIFTFGDARFLGSTGNRRLNAPVLAMAPTTDGGGYWLFARDGGVFTFGNARFYGSLGDLRGADPVIAAFNPG